MPKINLIFCEGNSEILKIPSTGLLTLDSYLSLNKDISVKIYDFSVQNYSKMTIHELIDVNYIGFGTWYHNYENTLNFARKLKKQKSFIENYFWRSCSIFSFCNILNTLCLKNKAPRPRFELGIP
jgi:hypothetical protein